MNLIEKAKNTYKYLKSSAPKTDRLSYTAFVLSLLPIPGLQQSMQVLDRIFSDKSLASQFNDMWEVIKKNKEDIAVLQEGEDKILSIIGTVKFNSTLNTAMEKLVNKLYTNICKSTSFDMTTEDWSYQLLINSAVDADLVTITADNNSINSIENSEIIATRTKLHALNNSSNFVNNSTFKGDNGSIVMQNMYTRGKVAVTGNTIELADGGQLIFGGNPHLITGNSCIYLLNSSFISARYFQ